MVARTSPPKVIVLYPCTKRQARLDIKNNQRGFMWNSLCNLFVFVLNRTYFLNIEMSE